MTIIITGVTIGVPFKTGDEMNWILITLLSFLFACGEDEKDTGAEEAVEETEESEEAETEEEAQEEAQEEE